MKTQSIPDFRNARIIDVARQGSTISGIAQQTGIPFPTVRRTVYAFENIGVIRTTKSGKKVFVRSTKNHPIINSMIETAKWVNTIIWNPDIFIASMFEKHGVKYAFVGTTRIKYVEKESRNMVQVAVPKMYCEKAKEMIREGFDSIGVKVTDDPRKTIGNAMSVVYVKCFPIDEITFEEFSAQSIDSDETIQINVADERTEQQVIQNMSKEDRMFIPYASA